MNRLSLSQKVFIALMVVFLIPTITITLQSLHCASEAVEDLQKDALQAQLNMIEREIDNWVFERVTDLQLWQEHQNLLKMLPENHQSHSHWKQDSSYQSLFLYDSQGLLVQRFGEYHTDKKSLKPHEIQLIQKKGYAVMDSLHTHEKGSYSIHLGVRVTEGSTVTGYTMAVLNISKTFLNIINQDAQSSPYKISIIGVLNRFIVGDEQLITQSDVSTLHGQENTLIHFENDRGEERIGVARDLPDVHMRLVVSADKIRTFSWITTLQQRVSITIVITFIFVILFGILIGKVISKPFKRILRYANKVITGEQSDILEETHDREGDVVVRAMNEMMQSLDKANIEIRQQATLVEVGEITSSVVHEFRNPLSSVKMNLQSLVQFCKDSKPYNSLSTIALEQTLKLENMLTELLSYGKPIVLDKKCISLDRVKEGIELAITPIQRAYQCSVTFNNVSGAGCVFIDFDKFLGVFVNIVENAATCTEHCDILIEYFIEDECDVWVLSDSGPGIPRNLLQTLFKPFVTSRDTGTGLGLAITRKIVHLHEGSIVVENGIQDTHDSNGAVFTIRIPRDEKACN
ncbi:MAG: HAMP domain-containing histidine kinase [Fibrobacterales bacterium]